MKPKEIFEKYGALPVKDVISKELCQFFTHVLSRATSYNQKNIDDPQVPNALGILSHEHMFDTLLERIWPAIEIILEQELLPTYSYARLYANDNVLHKHTDRPSCEVSMTIQLARSHHYAWPIYMGDQRFDLAEGDGVIYKGCDIEHWRDKCDGPINYSSGQVFLHFVKANGEYAEYAGDKRWQDNLPFIKHRQQTWENK